MEYRNSDNSEYTTHDEAAADSHTINSDLIQKKHGYDVETNFDPATICTSEEREKNPKRQYPNRRNRKYQHTASFQSPDQFEASEIHEKLLKICSKLYTRSRRYDTEGSRNDIYACCYARKTGWKFCPKKILIRFSKTSQEIVAWEIEGGTDVNFHWTPAQEEVFLRHKRNALIFRELREQD